MRVEPLENLYNLLINIS